MDEWLVVYRHLRRRHLDGKDRMLPRLPIKGVFTLCDEMHNRIFSQLLKKWMDLANIITMVGGSLGYYTLHFFRRGAVQHFFMLIINGKWSIVAVKWWGSWAE